MSSALKKKHKMKLNILSRILAFIFSLVYFVVLNIDLILYYIQQSWALKVFFNIFNNKNFFSSFFYIKLIPSSALIYRMPKKNLML